MKNSLKNRNDAFKKLIEKFGLRRKTVYNLIKDCGSLTDFEISEKMILPINSITGRRRELEELCLIKESGSKKNEKTDVLNTIWSVTSETERLNLINSKLSKLIKERDTLEMDLLSLSISNFSIELIKKQLKIVGKLIKDLK